MRVTIVQHVPFEGPGPLATNLRWMGHSIKVHHAGEGDYPPLDSFEGLVVLGGPMSVHDTDRVPWLKDELDFLVSSIRAHKPILGICLGAQALAHALGGHVTRNPEREIGFWPIQGVSTPLEKAFCFPPQVTVFHWHGETFSLPLDCHLLATSEGCAHQAFQYGDRLIGLQFHLEATAESVELLATHCPEDLAPGQYVQSVEAMKPWAEASAAREALLTELLSYLFDQCVLE